MSGDKRWYEFSPVSVNDIDVTDFGNILQVSGVLFQGQGKSVLVLAPDSTEETKALIVRPTAEEWSEILRYSDDPVFFETRNAQKIMQRKQRYAISGVVQQRVWARDGFKCMYCGARMGNVQLTIDHFVPLEMGGVNDTGNYLSACRRCNKDKGSTSPREFCEEKGLTYDYYVDYLENNSNGN